MATGKRLQAALEYLHTYIWMVIIIVIVLMALSYYAISGISARVALPPGSCFINRPYGPNTTQFVTLSGNCNSDLPEYAIHFNGQDGGAFNLYCTYAQASCVIVPSPFTTNTLVCNATISAWSYDAGLAGNGGGWSPSQYGATYGEWYAGGTSYNPQPLEATLGGTYTTYNTIASAYDSNLGFEYNDTLFRFEAKNYSDRDQLFVQGNFKGKWVDAVMTLSNGIAVGYINGVAVTPNSPNIGCIAVRGGVIGNWDTAFNGFITNVQVYNTALDSNTILQMYRDGPGAVPIDINHVVAWWQLNGNVNDSSGNGFTGATNDLSFSSGYPAPK